ncbi:MAG TPA: pinensin family lanthipeptide [Longimicrobium sp.]
MKKVKLQLDDLQVESFEVEADARGAGTVRGLEFEGSGVHSECLTHCATDGCEACESVRATHCDRECPSWDGACGTGGEWTCDWDCGGGTTIEA